MILPTPIRFVSPPSVQPETAPFGLVTPSGGVPVTTGASSNIQGSAASLGTLNDDIDALLLQFASQNVSGRYLRIDIFADATKIVEDMPVYFAGTSPIMLRLPVRIAIGSVISVAMACNVASTVIQVGALAEKCAVAETITKWTPLATVQTNTAATTTALDLTAPQFVQIGILGSGQDAANSGVPAKALLTCLSPASDLGRANSVLDLEIGTGAALSETTPWGRLISIQRSNDFFYPFLPIVRGSIANGTRLSLKATPISAVSAPETLGAQLMVGR